VGWKAVERYGTIYLSVEKQKVATELAT